MPKFRLLGTGLLMLLSFSHRASADPVYKYFDDYRYTYTGSAYYRQDQDTGEWDEDAELDDDWVMLEEPPTYLGNLVGITGWDFGSFIGAYSYNSSVLNYYRFEYDPTGNQWYFDYGDGTLYPWFDPESSTDNLYYWDGSNDNLSDNWIKYDALNEGTWNNLWASSPVCDYTPYGSGGGPEETWVLVTGDNWTYSMVDDVDYAYDTVSGQWYVDVGYDSDIGFDTWAPTDDPNE